MQLYVAIGKAVKIVQNHTTLQRISVPGQPTTLEFGIAQASDMQRELKELFQAYAANPEGD